MPVAASTAAVKPAVGALGRPEVEASGVHAGVVTRGQRAPGRVGALPVDVGCDDPPGEHDPSDFSGRGDSQRDAVGNPAAVRVEPSSALQRGVEHSAARIAARSAAAKRDHAVEVVAALAIELQRPADVNRTSVRDDYPPPGKDLSLVLTHHVDSARDLGAHRERAADPGVGRGQRRSRRRHTAKGQPEHYKHARPPTGPGGQLGGHGLACAAGEPHPLPGAFG